MIGFGPMKSWHLPFVNLQVYYPEAKLWWNIPDSVLRFDTAIRIRLRQEWAFGLCILGFGFGMSAADRKD